MNENIIFLNQKSKYRITKRKEGKKNNEKTNEFHIEE